MAAGSESQLADGRAVVLRLAGPADVPAITRLYWDLSPESFARRFHGGRLAPSVLARLASLDGGNGLRGGRPDPCGRAGGRSPTGRAPRWRRQPRAGDALAGVG
jgi:hypothetical protein